MKWKHGGRSTHDFTSRPFDLHVPRTQDETDPKWISAGAYWWNRRMNHSVDKECRLLWVDDLTLKGVLVPSLGGDRLNSLLYWGRCCSVLLGSPFNEDLLSQLPEDYWQTALIPVSLFKNCRKPPQEGLKIIPFLGVPNLILKSCHGSIKYLSSTWNNAEGSVLTP